MPPSKRKAKANVGPPVATLLARCSRTALEALLENSVSSGSPVTYELVCGALPEAKQSLVIARPKVTVGEVRSSNQRSPLARRKSTDVQLALTPKK